MRTCRSWTVKVGILALYCLCWQLSEAQQPACASARASDVKVYVLGKKDKTGQYVSTIKLHLGAENGRDAFNWTIQLGDFSQSCDGTILSQILVDGTVPANPNYQLFPGVGYYKFHTSAKKWEEGKEVCEHEGAHLVIINSEEELGVINLLYQRNRNDIKDADDTGNVGVGFHDMYVEGKYVTIYGEPLSSTGFIRWSKVPVQQPDNYQASGTHPGEDCGAILVVADGLMNDISCNSAMAFVCEQELARTLSVNNACVE